MFTVLERRSSTKGSRHRQDRLNGAGITDLPPENFSRRERKEPASRSHFLLLKAACRLLTEAVQPHRFFNPAPQRTRQ